MEIVEQPVVVRSPRERAECTILLAEDNEPLRRGLASILRHAGYRTLEACDGLDAVKTAVEQRALGGIDLLLTDVEMPVLSGVETAEWVRTLYPGVAVLVMSALDAENVPEVPDSVFIQKPFTFSELLGRIRHHMIHRPGQNL